MNVLDLNDFCIGTPPAQRMEQGRPLLDKGKPAERRGRKATGQAASLTAGLPKKGLKLTGTKGSAGNGDLLWSRLSVRVQALSSFPSATTRASLSFSRTRASAE